MLLPHTNIFFFLWWHEDLLLKKKKKSLYFPFPLYTSHKSVITPPNTRCFMNITLSLKVPKDHFFYSFQIMEATLQSRTALLTSNRKSCLEILRKVIKRASQVSEPSIHIFSFALISLPHSSPIILLWVLLRSDDQLSMATWKSS